MNVHGGGSVCMRAVVIDCASVRAHVCVLNQDCVIAVICDIFITYVT